MHLSTTVAFFLAAAAAAMPNPVQCGRDGLLPRRNVKTYLPKRDVSDETLNMCKNAVNCEVHDTPSGKRIRFKRGMEPGSEHYKRAFYREDGLTKRQVNTVNTLVTTGTNSLNYGTTGASGPNGAFNSSLTSACQDSACDTASVNVDTTYVTSLGPSGETLVVHPQGEYDDSNSRDMFIAAMVATASVGEQVKQVSWEIRAPCGPGKSGSMSQATQTSFINISRHVTLSDGVTTAIQGYMLAEVELQPDTSDWCSILTGLGTEISGVIGALPPVAEAGAAGAAFFGVISPSCS